MASPRKKEWSIDDPPHPVESIKFRMDQQGLRPVDLVPFIGSRSRVSEILSRTRPLTLRMIRNLHNGLGIPAQSLIQKYRLRKVR